MSVQQAKHGIIPTIQNIFDDGSKYIHLPNYFIHAISTLNLEKLLINIHILNKDDNINMSEKLINVKIEVQPRRWCKTWT